MLYPHYTNQNKFYLSEDKIHLFDEKNSDPITYEFSSTHIEIQNRIDRFLGKEFKSQEGLGVYKGRDGNAERWLCTFNNDTKDGRRNRFCQNDSSIGGWSGGHDTSHLVEVRQDFVSGTDKSNWLHGNSADDVMQKMFKSFTTDPNMYGVITPKDTYKSYNWPSQSTVDKYGNNLSFFIRCAPDNIGCKLFGKNISVKDALIILGSVVATIATGGAAATTLYFAYNKLKDMGLFTKVDAKLSDVTKTISDMTNIYNNADVIVKNGTLPELQNIAKSFINGNQNIFIPQS